MVRASTMIEYGRLIDNEAFDFSKHVVTTAGSGAGDGDLCLGFGIWGSDFGL